MSYSIKRLTTTGMLVAMEVVLSRFLSIRIPPTAEYLVKISFAFLPVAVAAMFFGPLWGGLCGALGDVIGALFFQAGSVFFPGFTLTAFLTGAAFGLFLYNRPVRLPNALAAAASVNVLCSLGLNSLWLYIMYGASSVAMLPGRALNAAAMTVVATISAMFFDRVLAKQKGALAADYKRELRAEARREFTKDPVIRQTAGERIAERVLALPEYQNADTVFCYVGIEKEIPTDAIIARALESGKRVCAPRCESDGTMTARELKAQSELVSGRYGLLEPPKSAAVIPPEETQIILVPALLCGRDFSRIGKGGGYYDKYLASSSAVKAALVLDSQLRRTLPRESHDQPMDIIVTESETLKNTKKHH